MTKSRVVRAKISQTTTSVDGINPTAIPNSNSCID
jgi:hypothetical protein